jgi:hypothetical protein
MEGVPPMTDFEQLEQRFWTIAGPLLQLPNVRRSTMMGLPCLRVNDAFFASWDRSTGALLVKLPAAEVDQLVADRNADPFAPAGRRFREWASVPADRSSAWPKLLDHALDHVSKLPPKPPRRKQ